MYRSSIDPQTLIGKTLRSLDLGGFTLTTGESYAFHHNQDCCELVEPIRIRGNIAMVLNAPLIAVKVHSDEPPEDAERAYSESYTWTCFLFTTAHGWAEVCWLGESNGYYGEDVEIIKI